MLRRLRPDLLAILGTYMLLGALLLLMFAAARAAGNWALNFESGAMRLLAAAAIVAAIVAGVLLVMGYRRSVKDRKSGFWLPVTTSVIAGVLFFAAAEAGMRILAEPDALGHRIGSTVLLPYEWPMAARANLALAKEHRSPDSFLVDDRELGWTIGHSRKSEDGLYKSSAEGLRSDTVGRRYSDESAAVHVALLGDSFAFSEEVGFEDSLGARLERQLAGIQVLNYGVPGYGVDQAVLRFRKDAVPRSPEAAILTFIADDLFRTANMYVFLKSSWGIPLSKPRFSLDSGGLNLLNSPTLSPEKMYAKASVFDLPWILRDIEFFPYRWTSHPLHASYLLRYLASRFPVWPASGRTTAEDAIVELSARVIEEFVATARHAGIGAAVVYLPTSGDFAGGSRAVKQRVLDRLETGGVQVSDLTDCVSGDTSGDDFFMSGGHYSGSGNAIVARCLEPIVAAIVKLNGASGL